MTENVCKNMTSDRRYKNQVALGLLPSIVSRVIIFHMLLGKFKLGTTWWTVDITDIGLGEILGSEKK